MTPVALIALALAVGLLALGAYAMVARGDQLGQLVGLAVVFSGVTLGAAGFALADPRRRSTGEVLALVVVVCATAMLAAGSALGAVARRRAQELVAAPDPEADALAADLLDRGAG
ncbi:MAG TPA: hypothetical protein VMW47_02225 [Verrucomicrobiae bacterium]|nr:hypothetical protein [Verrucomicrobiae bacterium]